MRADRSRWVMVGCAAALPLLVWYIGAFYFHGSLGRWIDDYGAHVRNPATGEIRWGELVRPQWWFFWRPIHIQLIYTLQTLFFNHDWVNHLFSAAMHALACVSLWRFLRVCGLRPIACAAPALILLGSAQGFEAVLWPATVSTSIATAAFFWAAGLAVRHARGERPGRAAVLLGVLGFVIPCLYEQPAAALAALPIVYLGAAGIRANRGALVGVAWRMVGALALCAIALVAYLALFYVTVRADPMAREAQFSGMGPFWTHARYLIATIGSLLRPFEGLRELWDAGVGALQHSAIGMFGWAGLVGAAVGAWMWMWWSEGANIRVAEAAQVAGRPVRGWVLVPFGVAALALSLVPIAAINGAGISPRLTYFPVACVLMAIGGVLDVVVRGLPRFERPMSAATALASAVVAIAGSIHLLGAQWHMKHRYEADMAFMGALRRAVPNPAAGTLLVPISWAPDPVAPSQPRTVNSFGPIWTSPWAINTEIKRVYGRNDVDAASSYGPNDTGALLRLGEPTTVAWSHYFRQLPTPRKDAVSPTVSTTRIIPYTVDARGEITVVRAITSNTPDGRPSRVEFSQAAAMGAAGTAVRDVALAIPLETGRPWISEWEWTHRAPPLSPDVKFQRIVSWGAADCATRMHPPVPGATISDGDTDEMTVPLPGVAGGGARRIVFHATFDESTIGLSVLGDGVELAWMLDGVEVKRVRLDPKDIKSRRAWETVVVEVPASAAGRTLKVVVGPGPSENPSYDRVIVTCGEEERLGSSGGATAAEQTGDTP